MLRSYGRIIGLILREANNMFMGEIEDKSIQSKKSPKYQKLNPDSQKDKSIEQL